MYYLLMLVLLTDLAIHGMGYHHAGMDVSDRKTMEAMFVAGDLPVLCMWWILLHGLSHIMYWCLVATSTLAMGVSWRCRYEFA